VLRDAYIKRDRVAMVAFRQRSAELIFGPTNQVELVRRALDTLPCGGTTPLAMGLELANVVLRRARARDHGRRPTLILVSDGRANVGSQPGYAAVLAEVESATRVLAEMQGLSIVFLDTTEAGKNDSPARHLVDLLSARRVVLAELDAGGEDAATLLSRLI
jgi:magnesium chelatase subunit D